MEMKCETAGSRKLIITKWSLLLYAVVSIAYLTLLGFLGSVPPENFFFSFVIGLGGVAGTFSAANFGEHWASAKK